MYSCAEKEDSVGAFRDFCRTAIRLRLIVNQHAEEQASISLFVNRFGADFWIGLREQAGAGMSAFAGGTTETRSRRQMAFGEPQQKTAGSAVCALFTAANDVRSPGIGSRRVRNAEFACVRVRGGVDGLHKARMIRIDGSGPMDSAPGTNFRPTSRSATRDDRRDCVAWKCSTGKGSAELLQSWGWVCEIDKRIYQKGS
ncbi:hypothetical protein BV898_16735 [Hypsibius exemplaris]|uniref:Uncharacterized protein n=1 Tax=Hypsibius exemplaris TaxID=2072580 RepID=A0A9X6NE23_HYPEX|nr:hypothetical protein BV898_16735 [Hypsibius exemplaris]